MTSECVCGFNPPEDPNPDCERCNLICRIAELEKQKGEIIERCLDVIMNYCDKHKRHMDYQEFMASTADCGCRVCLAEKAGS